MRYVSINIRTLLFGLLLAALPWAGCGRTATPSAPPPPIQDTPPRHDTLHVAIVPDVTSCFLLHGTTRGYDYELATDFARHLQKPLRLHFARTEDEAMRLLLTGGIDLVASCVPEAKAWKRDCQCVFPQSEACPVLVQRREHGQAATASDLSGRTVHVPARSSLHRQLTRLNEETGGNIRICALPATTDSLIGLVRDGRIDFTVAYRDRAVLHRRYAPTLHIAVPLGFARRGGWMVRRDDPALLAALEQWQALPATTRLEQRLAGRYKHSNPALAATAPRTAHAPISPYDDLFRRHAPAIGWDWRLLASIAFHESTFDPATMSRRGAAGLMQLMPRTAAIYGVDSTAIFEPDDNIRAAVAYLRDIGRLFRHVPDPDERAKFILAGYNGGPFHVVDAMALAERYGRNPHVWQDNVEYFLRMKKLPFFYQDPVARYGRFNARETVRYVQDVLETYEGYVQR